MARGLPRGDKGTRRVTETFDLISRTTASGLAGRAARQVPGYAERAARPQAGARGPHRCREDCDPNVLDGGDRADGPPGPTRCRMWHSAYPKTRFAGALPDPPRSYRRSERGVTAYTHTDDDMPDPREEFYMAELVAALGVNQRRPRRRRHRVCARAAERRAHRPAPQRTRWRSPAVRRRDVHGPRRGAPASASPQHLLPLRRRPLARGRRAPRPVGALALARGRPSTRRSTKKAQAAELVPFEPNKYKIANVLEALKAIGHIAEGVQPPVWLDGISDDPYQRGRDRPARERDPALRDARAAAAHSGALRAARSSVRVRPDAPTPTRWLRFLDELWGDDEESKTTLAEWFGYVLSNDTVAAEDVPARRPEAVGQGNDRPRPDRAARRAQHRRADARRA